MSSREGNLFKLDKIGMEVKIHILTLDKYNALVSWRCTALQFPPIRAPPPNCLKWQFRSRNGQSHKKWYANNIIILHFCEGKYHLLLFGYESKGILEKLSGTNFLKVFLKLTYLLGMWNIFYQKYFGSELCLHRRINLKSKVKWKVLLCYFNEENHEVIF